MSHKIGDRMVKKVGLISHPIDILTTCLWEQLKWLSSDKEIKNLSIVLTHHVI